MIYVMQTKENKMSKYKNFLITEQENTMDNIDGMWHQKQLEEEQQIAQIKERNLFEWQAIQDAIYYSKRLKIAEKNIKQGYRLDYLTQSLGLYVKLYYNVVVWVVKAIHDAIVMAILKQFKTKRS